MFLQATRSSPCDLLGYPASKTRAYTRIILKLRAFAFAFSNAHNTTQHDQLGTKLLARQMRFEDDQDKPLLFYAASSKRSSMLVAVRHLLQDTIGLVGLGDQVRHLDANEGNVLMQACNDPGAFEVVWELLESNGWLEEQLSATDRDGRGWLLHAAEAGNSAVLSKLRVKDHIQEATFEWDQQQRQGKSLIIRRTIDGRKCGSAEGKSCSVF